MMKCDIYKSVTFDRMSQHMSQSNSLYYIDLWAYVTYVTTVTVKFFQSEKGRLENRRYIDVTYVTYVTEDI